MCLIIFAYQKRPAYRPILAANRDEFYERPTRPAAFRSLCRSNLSLRQHRLIGLRITRFKFRGRRYGMSYNRGFMNRLQLKPRRCNYGAKSKPIKSETVGFKDWRVGKTNLTEHRTSKVQHRSTYEFSCPDPYLN